MRIDYLQQLYMELPATIAPSKYGWLSRCLLRVLYSNKENDSYETGNTSAMIGTLIHSVREDYDGKRISSYEDFEKSWERAEAKLDLLGTLRESCLNYGLRREGLWREFEVKLTGAVRIKKSESKIEILRDHAITDSANHISGKIDALVLKDGSPLEIREYKTGNAYSTVDSSGVVDLEALMRREDHRLQLMLYGWLVYSRYGRLPKWMNFTGPAGKKWQIDFSLSEITSIKAELVKRYNLVRDNVECPGALASPSLTNCSRCIYRFSCKDCSVGILGDFSGIVRSVRIMPFGNFEIVLVDGRRLINPRNDHGLTTMDLLGLVDKAIIVTQTISGKPRLGVGGGIQEVYAPKPYSIIKVLLSKGVK